MEYTTVLRNGRRISIISGPEITVQDIMTVSYLDIEAYQEKYHLTVETCAEYIQRNPYIYAYAG